MENPQGASSVAPNRSFGTERLVDLAIDADGNVYGSDYQHNQISVYSPSASGHDLPLKTIAGPATGISNPQGLAIGPDGELYVASLGSASIQVFAPGATGDQAPMRTIKGVRTLLFQPMGLALDALGNLYVANRGTAMITVYGPEADGDVAPVNKIHGLATALSKPQGIALDAAGQLFVASAGSGTINVYAPGARGNAVPLRCIRGAKTGLTSVYWVTVTLFGLLYATNAPSSAADTPAVMAFDASASGDVAPLHTYTGPNSHISYPYGLTVTPGGSVLVTDFVAKAIESFAPPAPTVTSVSPEIGPVTGGMVISVTGTNFTPCTTVSIGGTVATSIQVSSATFLTVELPPHTAGLAEVLLKTDGGDAVAASPFRYEGPETPALLTATGERQGSAGFWRAISTRMSRSTPDFSQ